MLAWTVAGAAAIWAVATGRPWIGLTLTAGLALGLATAGQARRLTAIAATRSSEPHRDLSRDVLAEALDGLPDPHLVIETSGAGDRTARRIRFANQTAMTILGVERDGQPLTAALRDPQVLDAVDQALADGSARSVDYESAGTQRRHWRAFTVGLPADGITRAVLRLRDETDSRRMEAMRVDFLANASHELRTPLAALAGFIETLRGHARDDEAARERFLSIMSVQADRMSRLVADLLSLSRIELNEHVPPTDEADLVAVVLDVLDATTGLAGERGVTLCMEPARPSPIRVIGDRDQLVQVVQNLVDNAVKYSPQGGHVTVSLRNDLGLDQASEAVEPGFMRLPLVMPDRRGAAAYARLTVRDVGTGMAREHLPRLTERFYRVEGQKSGERSGTGLGLAIVKHIANRHGGGLVVESKPGAGTLFSVFVPAASQGVTNREV